MTGAFLRAKNTEGKFDAIEVEHLTKEQRWELFKDRSPRELVNWLDCVCEELVKAENILNGLVEDGILQRK